MEPNVARIMSSEELEIARLKAKANKLIDVNQQLVREKAQLQETIQRLQRVSNAEIESGASEEDKFTFIYITRILVFLAELQKSALWLDYKNNTANTKEYYRVDKRDFENILAAYTDDKVTARNFIRYMVCLGIMKSNDKEIFSVIVNGKSKRVYMIRKTAVDLPGVEKYER